MSVQTAPSRESLLDSTDKQRLEDVGFHDMHDPHPARQLRPDRPFRRARWPIRRITSRCTLSGPQLGGLRHDYRRPKHPYGDKFMLAAGHCAPTCYALWMIMGEALYRKFKATGDKKYYVAPKDGFLSIDALGFRRGAGALKTLLSRIRGSQTTRCSRRPKRAAAASTRSPGTSSRSIRATTSTAGRRASASPPPPARRRSGTWSARRSISPK